MKATPDIYTSGNIFMSTETVFLTEFSLTCENNAKDVHLYAEVNGNVMPVTRSADDTKYQVSWSVAHKKAPSGTYKINFMDEEGYSNYRKAQRSGESTEIKPLFTLDINHKGAGREGLWVQTEFLAVVAALLIWWSANNIKNKIQDS
ncbi:translocon-associated protein subunit delta-like isoform X3 [Actinia tenebrosa]|uniref:Translocon-associated protein subunit delta n=1 Tax=Actinia tenebrosa TaxID=6105 RepID=A0A6P8IHP9_ACTTE|nr:translocon-associated protein subunit delta-like isoform X3 [Actinia tenebrosa]